MFGNQRKPGEGKALLLAMLPFFSLFPALLLMLGALRPQVLVWCLGDADSVSALLRACRNDGLILLAAMLAGLLITLLSVVLAVRGLRRLGAGGLYKGVLQLALIALLAEGLLFYAMALREGLLTTVRDAQADLKQLEAGQTEAPRLLYFAAGGGSAAHLPVPYAAGQPAPLTRYPVLEENGQWTTLYVPACLDFTPAGTWQTGQSREWNEANVPCYQVVCTGRLGWAADIRPVS